MRIGITTYRVLSGLLLVLLVIVVWLATDSRIKEAAVGLAANGRNRNSQAFDGFGANTAGLGRACGSWPFGASSLVRSSIRRHNFSCANASAATNRFRL